MLDGRKEDSQWQMTERSRELERFLAERADRLMRTAVLLTGSRDAARTCCRQRWSGCCGTGGGSTATPRDTCAGRSTTWPPTASGARGRLQRKLLLLRAGTQPPADPIAEVDLRDALVRLLLQLPPRQRAVLVLRYWEQLTEAETAAVLGWPEGTVKSAARAGCGGCGSSPTAGSTQNQHSAREVRGARHEH